MVYLVDLEWAIWKSRVPLVRNNGMVAREPLGPAR